MGTVTKQQLLIELYNMDGRRDIKTRCRHFLYIALFVCISCFLIPSIKIRDVYPFYNWDLFGEIENHIEDYNFRVVALDGVTIDRPCYLNDCPLLKVGTSKDTGLYAFTQDFARIFRQPHQSAALADYEKHLKEVILAKYSKATVVLIKRKYSYEDFRLNQGFHEEDLVEFSK